MKRQRGLSLIEVMVSILILALGLLGLAGLQTRAVIMNQSSYYRSIAADIGAELGDRIRANRTPFLASSDALPVRLPPDFSKCTQNSGDEDHITCQAQDTGHDVYLVSTEMTEWNSFLRSQLPNATYTLTSGAGQSTGFYRYTLTITWNDNRAAATGSQSTSYSTVLE
ncbi:type IV pilus modification protein PilV [Chitinibacter bivalviorum]|uniref:Type IV pilus modification protein PilV n=1 Tax=Chitinibacter bivalviorum TaxID=2739434 RepID=A0A7H9BPD4_9NEIS|nr:type IV pilus modification protein PilV [Chitinibacter bivalviorum]QLG89204.1 type IV pilus modification protein PilV [Chitinibacter bivalviorum]